MLSWSALHRVLAVTVPVVLLWCAIAWSQLS